jgi:hypothetical protein
MYLIKLSILINLTLGQFFKNTTCSVDQETKFCLDAESWTSGSGGMYYARVCDNNECSKAWFDAHDGFGTCSVQTELY